MTETRLAIGQGNLAGMIEFPYIWHIDVFLLYTHISRRIWYII